MGAALLARWGPWAAIALLVLLSLRQHEQLVTWRLKDKDQQAIAYNLRRDLGDRDRVIIARSAAEAGDRGAADRACASDISASFQKGVAVGRAISHAATIPDPGRGTVPGVVRDYRQAWAVDAYAPGS